MATSANDCRSGSRTQDSGASPSICHCKMFDTWGVFLFFPSSTVKEHHDNLLESH